MKTTSFKKAQICYSDTGKGTAIVLLHGFLENKKMWNHYTSFLSEEYRVITIDLLGHGESDCLGYVHEMEDNARAVNQVLKDLKIEKAALLGHSMGGYVVLAFAELFPEKTKGIILLNSTAKEDSAERKTNRLRAIKAVQQNLSAFVSMAVSNLFSEDNRNRLIAEIEKVKKEALQTPLQGVIASLEGMRIRKNREFILQESTFPMLLILGKKDPVLNYDETVQQIKDTSVQLVSFPDGHMSSIENQEELITILQGFLSEI
ncbi:alpha/beta fold hydrolase [Flavobacterium agrisoli]|uniref:Alpha/beta fold hydrolase n=1 Tax=Flavobacterium agrisoli TaxID=2793066 RepID=A0A934UJU4_9FLAO|nr:alpha/beta fold hydrolase [Flavobacterium agrisoli]MBK0369780.1 alpha/beta fold hydrolase [Flavobacterium agrisoli]